MSMLLWSRRISKPIAHVFPEMEQIGSSYLSIIWCAYSLPTPFESKLLFFQTNAMSYFERVSRGLQNPPRIHPLLLSLVEAWNASNSSPNLHSISENDPRVIGSQYYTSASELPPLNTHFSGNGENLGIGSCLTAMPTNNPKGNLAAGMLAVVSCSQIILYLHP
jgi:hypothetical protein